MVKEGDKVYGEGEWEKLKEESEERWGVKECDEEVWRNGLGVAQDDKGYIQGLSGRI